MSMYTLKILLHQQDFFVCWQNYNSYNILKFGSLYNEIAHLKNRIKNSPL